MSTVTALAIVLVVAVSTYVMRAGLIVLLADTTLPVPLERALRYAGPAVLSALAINLAAGGDGGPHLEVAEVAALVVAGAVAVWRRSLVVALVVGMVVLWSVSALT